MSHSEFQLNSEQQQQLLQLARDSIAYGRIHHRPLNVDNSDFDAPLNRIGCCFVTLEKQGQLRGCIGALAAFQPLAKDVADHAFAAAFEDSRFPPLQESELDQLEIEISVLTPAQELQFNDEADLLRQIRPGIDGVIIEDGHHRATFLPSVWSKLPEPDLFFEQLKQKAGLSADHWSDKFRAWTYQSHSFH